jgi:hypothetical protein
VRSRAVGFGLPEDRLVMHFEAVRLLLDGVRVTDLDAPAPKGRIHISGSGGRS